MFSISLNSWLIQTPYSVNGLNLSVIDAHLVGAARRGIQLRGVYTRLQQQRKSTSIRSTTVSSIQRLSLPSSPRAKPHHLSSRHIPSRNLRFPVRIRRHAQMLATIRRALCPLRQYLSLYMTSRIFGWHIANSI